MSLQEKIQNDLKIAISSNNVELKDHLKVIVGEFQRQAKKELSDDEVLRILKKLEKSELELLQAVNCKDSIFLRVLDIYLPKMTSDEEIVEWIGKHIDFSTFKNKMQAVGVVMKHFGSSADGNKVKAIIQSM